MSSYVFSGIKRSTHIASMKNSVLLMDVRTVRSIISQLIVPKVSYTDYAWRPCYRLLAHSAIYVVLPIFAAKTSPIFAAFRQAWMHI